MSGGVAMLVLADGLHHVRAGVVHAANAINLLKPSILVNTDRIKNKPTAILIKSRRKMGR